MPFQLTETTKVLVTNANPRRELHGEERVRAIDISFCFTGENTLLDLIEPGLRSHHYTNRAADAHQTALPDMLIPLPNIRFPHLPLSYKHREPKDKLRGYRFQIDYGIDEARVDFTDAVLCHLHYEIAEGGSVKVMGTIQYNGEELADNDLYGMLSGLASEGEIYIRLIAPPELKLAKKGYRAGRPDTPQGNAGGNDGQARLDDEGPAEGEEDRDDDDEPRSGPDGEGPQPGSPEAAFVNGAPAQA